MKPANVMVQKDGKVVLIDFGTAREFKESQAEDTLCLGTCGYAAPEQYKGQGQSDIRTDIYCLGVTLIIFLQGITLFVSPMKSILFDIGIQICHPVLK